MNDSDKTFLSLSDNMIANCIKHYTFRVHMAENKIKYYNDEDMVSLYGKDMVVLRLCESRVVLKARECPLSDEDRSLHPPGIHKT